MTSSSARVTVDFAATFDAGVLLLWIDDRHWGKLCLVLRARQQLVYTVHARRIYPKGTELPADLFTRTGRPRLVLITCGGPFDETTHTYRDNVVVFAVPAG